MVIGLITAVTLVIYDDKGSKEQIQSLIYLKDSAEKSAKDAEKRELIALEDRSRIEKELNEINEQIKPIVKLARAKYPNLSIDKAIERLSQDLKKIENDLASLKEKTQEQIYDLTSRPNFDQEMFSMLSGIPAAIIRDYHKALEYYDAKDYENALKTIKKTLIEYEKGIPYDLKEYSAKEHNEFATEFYILTAKASQRLGKNILAYEYAVKAKQFSKTHYSYYIIAASAYNIRKYDESFKMINKALSLNPPVSSVILYENIKQKCEDHLNKEDRNNM
jgi:tetratricopeptide (TPR) repeat protein